MKGGIDDIGEFSGRDTLSSLLLGDHILDAVEEG
jgi:hypothetical protein